MRKVTKFTGFFIIPIGIALFTQAYFVRGSVISESVLVTSAGLLGMLPKGLVLLISISLATGIIKLSKKKVLVQEMYSIETLAHVDVLCLDKTGTITEGKMKVSNFYEFDNKDIPITPYDAMTALSRNLTDNNSTFLALREHYKETSSLQLVDTIPFSSERKWSAANFKDVGTLVLGAPEKLLQMTDFKLPEEIIKIQKMGRRVLLLGYTKKIVKDRTLPKLIIMGAIELDDPLKKNSKEMFHYFKNEGVAIKVISGDNPLTVSSIAKKAGIDGADKYIDMTDVNDNEISNLVCEYNVFARVNPTQKALIVKALREQGHTVAMTGDGVNDVIALREADIGITLPNGSDVTKQICQIVLLDSDFGVLKDVLMEGRRVVNNITNIARIFFIKTIYSVILCLINIVLNIPFPFIPIQITLIDAAIEGYTSFFITFEPNNKKVSGPFLKTVLKSALPYALTIILCIVAVMSMSSHFNISAAQGVTFMYYLLGFVSIQAVIKVCRPFNKLRIFLCTTTAVGFYVATYLFRNLLHLTLLSSDVMLLFIILAFISIFINKLFMKIIVK